MNYSESSEALTQAAQRAVGAPSAEAGWGPGQTW